MKKILFGILLIVVLASAAKFRGESGGRAVAVDAESDRISVSSVANTGGLKDKFVSDKFSTIQLLIY